MQMRIADAVRESPFLVGDVLNWPAKLYPNKVAIQWEDGQLAYAELWSRVEARSGELARLGVGRFQRWGLLYPNCCEFIITLFALLRRGAVAVPLSTRYPLTRLSFLAEKAHLTGILVGTVQAGQRPILQAFVGWRLLQVDAQTQAVAANEFQPTTTDPVAAIDLDPALILFTSGSTGATRGVVLQHHAILANLKSNIAALGYRDEDQTLVILPMCHAYALIHQVLAHLLLGATIHLPSIPLVAPALWHHLQREQITTLVMAPPWVPMLTEALRARPVLETLRLLTIGTGATCPDHLAGLAPLLPRTQIALTYGLTEAGPRVSTYFLSGRTLKSGSIGTPLPNVEVRILTTSGANDELVVRSRSTSQRAADDLFVEASDGVIRTGDVVRLCDDELVLCGRLRRALNRGGRLIAPQDIENVLRGHAAVQNAFVKSDSDESRGEVPIAFVSPHPGASIDINELHSYCAMRLGPDERPARIVVGNCVDRTIDKEEMLTSLLDTGRV